MSRIQSVSPKYCSVTRYQSRIISFAWREGTDFPVVGFKAHYSAKIGNDFSPVGAFYEQLTIFHSV